MRFPFCLVLLIAAVLHAGETIASGVYPVAADEDTMKVLTYGNVRSALVTGDGGTSTYRYRIKTLGSSTLFLKNSGGTAVVLGTTVLMPTAATADQTTSLQYQAIADEFTLFPTTSTRASDPVAVCLVDVLSGDGSSTVAANITLSIDVQGVTDTRNGGYYNGSSSTDLTQPAAVDVVAGQNLVLTYQQIAAMCNWTDKERDGQLNRGGGPGFLARSACLIDNPVGSLWPDGTYATTYLAYGGTMTIQIPADQPLGLNNLFNFAFEYDADGPGNVSTIDGRTNIVEFRVNVVSAGGSGSNGGGGGGGGCGAGTVGGLILVCSFSALRRRRLYRI